MRTELTFRRDGNNNLIWIRGAEEFFVYNDEFDRVTTMITDELFAMAKADLINAGVDEALIEGIFARVLGTE